MRRAWLLLALALDACGSRAEPHGSALLITIDTTRADALSCYGNKEKTTPALDALAAEGVLFERAHTVMALTLPAHTSMLTGLTPLRHGLRDNGVGALSGAGHTLAEAAAAAGVDTAAFVSSVVLDDDFGLAQGFAVYSVPVRRGAEQRSHGAERPGRETVDLALDWLAKHDPTRPFFLWVHLYEPHAPYEPVAPFAGQFSTNYLGEVACADHEVGRLLAELKQRGLLARTFVLALADHGEAFGEHGEVTHGTFCYEPTLHIPLIARWPDGRRAGEHSPELVSSVDVAPTLAEALGLAPLADIDGASFYSRAIPAERGVYFESYYGYFSCGWSPLTGWMDARGKYLHSSEPEFYDWLADPAEAHDLIAEKGAVLEDYRRPIARLADEPALVPDEFGGNGETLEGIAALGYTGGGEDGGALPHPLADTKLPGPRSQSGFFARQARAQELSAAGKLDEAAAIYAEVLRATPDNFYAMDELGTLRMQQRRDAEAIEILTKLAHAGPQRGRYYQKLGLALVQAGKLAEAVAPLTKAVELTSGRRRYLDTLREVLEKLGRGREMDALEQRFAKPGQKE